MPLIRKPTASTPPPDVAASDPLTLLQTGTAEQRWAAARAAASLPNGATALAAALRAEPDPNIREAMFTSLARIRSPASVTALLPFLRMQNASLRTGARDALHAMADVVGEALPALLSDADIDVRIQSCELARSLPSDDATRLLCRLLARESEANVCAAAIDVLTEVGNVDALPALTKCAQQFQELPFMQFAVQVATARILSQADKLTSESSSMPPQSLHE